MPDEETQEATYYRYRESYKISRMEYEPSPLHRTTGNNSTTSHT